MAIWWSTSTSLNKSPKTSIWMFFFFNDTATTEIYTLSLHDALPISPADGLGNRLRNPAAAPPPPSCGRQSCSGSPSPDSAARTRAAAEARAGTTPPQATERRRLQDRKSKRLNSSHGYISYAVFCLKKNTEVALVHPPTQNQRYGSSHIGATAKDISNVVTDAASGVVDIFHGIDKAVADTWNNFWKDGKADGIGSNLSRK